METKTVTEKEISTYIKAIKKALVCKNAKTKQMLADLVNDILCYCEENPNSTFEDIKKHFGEPNTVAEEFSIGFDDNYIKKYKFMQFFKIAVIAILTAILLFIGTLTVVIVANNRKTTAVDFDVEIKYNEVIE